MQTCEQVNTYDGAVDDCDLLGSLFAELLRDARPYERLHSRHT